MNKTLAAVVFVLIVAYNNVPAEDIRPGLWKITVESSVAAAPDWKTTPVKLTQCLTEDDAKYPDQLLASLGGQGVNGCEFLNRVYTGNSMKFDLSCGGQLGIKGHGAIEFTATSVDGVLDVSFGGENKTDMQNMLHATYLGNCPAAGGSGL